MPIFEHQTQLDCSVENLFDFLIRPQNVAKVSDPSLGIKFVAPPEIITAGIELDFQIVTFGQIHTLKYRISELAAPSLVIEEQVVGPMKAWRHIHRYEAHENGCIKRDRVEFDPPGGMVGFFLTEAKIVDQLEEGMFVREQKLNDLIQQGILT